MKSVLTIFSLLLLAFSVNGAERRTAVNFEGRLWDGSAGAWLANTNMNAQAVTAYYDDGKNVKLSEPVAINTDANGFFAVPIAVEDPNGSTHNVTSVVVRVDDNVSATLRVPTVPYALVAAAAEYVESKETAVLAGDANGVSQMTVDGVVVAEALTLDDKLTAGSVQGNADIRLSGITLNGGSLEWLGGTEEGTFATLSTAGVTYSGGDETYDGVLDNDSMAIAAKHDGFCQVTLNGKPVGGKMHAGLKVQDLVVTPTGDYDQRAANWTVPVRKGETVTLTGSGDYRFNFIYFGKGK